jgi:glycosyltransferase involved in cell wall biosynthesis
MNLITICIPTYRRPSQLLHALHSCVAQDYRPLEIDIGDDSPGDDSELLVASLVAPDGVTIRYTRNRQSLGQSGNVNALFAKARGSRILLLHDDDVLAAGAVAALAAAFDGGPDIVAAYGLQDVISESGEFDRGKTDALNVRYARTARYAGLRTDPVICALRRQFPNDGYLVDAALARAVGYRPTSEVGESCDTDFSLRLALQARGKAFYLLDRTTCRYRLNRAALSGSRNISWKFYDYLLTITEHLSPPERAVRDALLGEIAVKALTENAVHGRRLTALRILLSGHYPLRRKLGIPKLLYHLGLIAVPQIDKLRRRTREAIG